MTAGWSLYRYGGKETVLLDPELQGMQPYVLAGLSAFGIGMLSLSICFIVPTYLMLGLAVAYVQMANRSALLAPPPLRFDISLMSRFAAAGVCTLGGIYVFVRFVA